MFSRFLVNYCNPLSGNKRWKIVAFCGYFAMMVWIVCALPFGGFCLHIHSLGEIKESTFIAYSFYEISSKGFDYYFLSIFFGIAVAKFGYVVYLIGSNYAQGYCYLGSGQWSTMRVVDSNGNVIPPTKSDIDRFWKKVRLSLQLQKQHPEQN